METGLAMNDDGLLEEDGKTEFEFDENGNLTSLLESFDEKKNMRFHWVYDSVQVITGIC